jgi:hypothetical protein
MNTAFGGRIPVSIRVVYHPSSGLQDKTLSVEDYLKSYDITQTTTMNDKPETSSESVKGSKIRPPWYPFKSATDFDFAEYVVQNNLSQPAIEDLLRRQRNVWTTSPDAVNISFKNYKDLRYYLDRAKSSRTNVIILFYFLHIYLLMRLSV